MRSARAWLFRLSATLTPWRRDREIADELNGHLELAIEDNVRAGMTRSEGRRQALLTLGGFEPTLEQARHRRGMPILEARLADLRYAFRRVRRTPGFTVVVVFTLALGSGVNAAIFSIFDQALLRILPVPEPDRLVNLSSPGPKVGRLSTSGTFGANAAFSYPLFRDLEQEQPAFTGIAAYRDFTAHVSYRNQASTETGLLVSGSYFHVLAAQPALGRFLGADDDRVPGAHHVVVLSHAYWRERLGANPAVLNDSLVVNGQSLTIVGVAPQAFEGTTLENRPTIFVPLTMASVMMPGLRNPHAGGGPWNGFGDRRDHWLYLFARLKPGLSRDAAEQAVNIPFAAILRDVELPAQRGGMSDAMREEFTHRRLFLEAGPHGQRPERDELSNTFLLLFCVTGVVLVISCANIANLMLARAAAYERDVTVRLSLGAPRRRLVMQSLTESVLFAAGGCVGGFVMARCTVQGLASLVPAQGNAMFRFEIDSTVLLFGVALSVAMPLLFGLYPALIGTRFDVTRALRGGTAGTRSSERFRMTLAGAQIALSMALLVVAGLFTKSLMNLNRVDLGMRVANVTTFRISPELNGYNPVRSQLLFRRVEQELPAIPGITAVGASTMPVLAGAAGGSNVTVEGFAAGPDTNTSANSAAIGQGYFRTLSIPLLAGRDFTGADAAGAPRVAIVNEAFAGKFNLGSTPIGRRMFMGAGRLPFDIEIVGFVKDARQSWLKDPAAPMFFVPYAQRDAVGALDFYVQSTLPVEGIQSAIREVVGRFDPTLPIENLRPLSNQVGDTVVLDRLTGTLSLGFALLATLLAAIGLYGVLAYNLSQRTRELGLRMALGASIARMWRTLLGYVGRIAIVSGTVGVGGALVLGRLAESQLFHVAGFDPAVMVVAAVGIAAIAFGAGAITARRATRLDPVVALRYE